MTLNVMRTSLAVPFLILLNGWYNGAFVFAVAVNDTEDAEDKLTPDTGTAVVETLLLLLLLLDIDIGTELALAIALILLKADPFFGPIFVPLPADPDLSGVPTRLGDEGGVVVDVDMDT